MPVTRRTNGDPIASSSTTRSEALRTTNSRAPPPSHSPFTPTSTERLLAVVYPLTLFLGAAFSHLSPTLRPPYNLSTYNPIAQSFQPDKDAPSYFARKRNVFNVYFVKRGWFWTTVALFMFVALVSRGRAARGPGGRAPSMEELDETERRHEKDNRIRRRWQVLLRYLLATFTWVLVTQWCFGPPLIDRGFAWTGGVCDLATSVVASPEADVSTKKQVASVLTHAACNMAGGTWRGGYDISGHVFILVLGSGMLWMEMLPFLARSWKGVGVARIVRLASGKVGRVGQVLEELSVIEPGHALKSVNDATRKVQDNLKNAARKELDAHPQLQQAAQGAARSTRGLKHYGAAMALATAILSWWMLLMTAAFFHTWFEKLTGWLLAFSTLWVMYYLPRGSPLIREAVGMPGV